MDYYQVSVHTSPEEVEIALAFLSQLPFDTFEELESGLSAFIPVSDFTPEVERQLNDLQAQLTFEWDKQLIPAQNWNAQWEAGFQPILVGDFCAIRADFHEPLPGMKHEIIINPKMAFGTGHHETTYMVIELMEKLPFAGKKVLDYGCGTGVLAILAALRGASNIDAIDYDILSYENTLENLQVNGIDQVTTYHGTLERLHDQVYDIILANINRNVILESLPALYSMLPPEGILVISGFLLEDQELLMEAALKQGLHSVAVSARNKWLCIHFQRNI